GNPAEPLERVEVTADEGRHIRAADELHVQQPRPAEDHDEGPVPLPLPARRDIGEVAKVAGDHPRKDDGASASAGIEFAQLRAGLLNALAADAHGPNPTPIPVNLHVLPARRAAQAQSTASRSGATAKSMNLLG